MTRPTGGRRPSSDGVQWFRALVIVVVLVVIGVVILARSSGGPNTKTAGSAPATKPSTPATTVPAPTTTTVAIPASQVKVQVLNGVLVGSLAGQWSTKLKTEYGYITEPPDNATSKVTASAIYILTPGYQAEADELAARVGIPSSAVDPTVPAPASAPIPATERSTANLVLVIGPDLAGSGG